MVPKKPLKIRNFLLTPNGEIPAFRITTKLKINETIDLNSTISVVGKCTKYLTQSCMSEKPKTETNMYFMPFDMATKVYNSL